jgi:formylglycine-generating enzyme required for sulfatase activity
MKAVIGILALMMFPTSSIADEMLELAKKNGCSACHAIDQKAVGPSWQDIALRYRNITTYEYAGDTYSLEDGLVKKVSLGGRLHWGDAIMLPNKPDETPQSDIRKLVRFIIRLAGNSPLTMQAFKEQGVEPGNGKSFKDSWFSPEMVMVQAGTFMMGMGNAQKQQTIAQPFAVGKYEVTFAEWDFCVADGGCNKYQPDDQGWGHGQQPVINVSWNDATKYAQWLTQKTGHTYRLLTATKWEYAARAGTTTAYPWGEAIGKGNANCDGCGSQWDGKQPAPVGSFQANAFGLYDMNGNVSEWVEDCAKTSCGLHQLYGGSWFATPLNVRTASNGEDNIDGRDLAEGFRVARTLP